MAACDEPMGNVTRRSFVKTAAKVATLAMATPGIASAATANGADVGGQTNPRGPGSTGGIYAPADSPWVSVRILDTDGMPWPPPLPPLGWQSKTLFENKQTKSRLHIISVPIGTPGYYLHYHTFHEWAYWLTGDFTNNESGSPYQHMGPLQRYREGFFLSRPPYSLHGGELHREEFMQSQVGGTCLIMEEGGQTHTVEPGGPGYNPDFKSIKHWSTPRIIDTIGLMPWEASPDVPGLKTKWLVDDGTMGFGAKLYWLPAGWNSSQSPQFARSYYYKQAHQFNYIVAGQMQLQTYRAPGRAGDKVAVGPHFFIDRAPRSVFGLAEGEVTSEGCVWLEATYARGTEISGNGIEDPSYL